MWKLIYFSVFAFWAANAQENAIRNVPKSLLECYNNTYLLDRNNRLPHNLPSLIAIIRKIEDNPELNMDLRTLTVALLHRFRQDGIIQDPSILAQKGVTPYAPNLPQFHRQAETLRLIPGNAMAFPNNSISNVERCSLHAMLSSSIEMMERGDETTTCRTISPYGYTRRWRKRSIARSSGTTEDVETLTDEQIKKLSNNDESKSTNTDPNDWYPPLPPNHPDSARVYAMPRDSDCPVEKGVLMSEWGALAGGSILAGIAAGLQPQSVRLGILLKKEWQSSDALSSITLDNKWIATIAGDLAEVILRQSPLAEKQLIIGVGGHWNSTALPRWYFLNSNENLYFTAAEIRADLDGLILASEIGQWYARVPSLRLSQILDMYYSDRGVFNLTMRACNRKSLLTSVAPKATIVEQAYRSALVLGPALARVTIDPETIEKFALETTEELLNFIPSSMDDPTCGDGGLRKQFHRISTDITIFLDTNWPFASVQLILASLLGKLDISKYNSNFTLISANDGTPMINSSDSILDFYQFNETQYNNFARGFNLPRTFETIKSIQSRKLEDEKNRGIGGRNSEIMLIVPYTSTLTDADKAFCSEALKRLREDAPDTKIMFLTYGGKDRWLELVDNAVTDISSVGVSTTPDNFAPIDALLTTIKQVPRRLVNSQCGSTYSRSGNSFSVDDYLEPSGINFYRMHPNYFYTTEENKNPTIKIKASDSTSLTVCTSREILHVNTTSTSKTCETTSNTHTISVSCSDAKHIHECNPLYVSVYVNSSSNSAYQCTDMRFCRYPDMTKITISYEDLVCVNGASSILISPIIFLTIIVCSYIH